MSSTIEELLYSAHKHSKRQELLSSLRKIRQEYPNKDLTDLYQIAYEYVMKTA